MAHPSLPTWGRRTASARTSYMTSPAPRPLALSLVLLPVALTACGDDTDDDDSSSTPGCVACDGIIDRVAGGPYSLYGGDGGPASDAMLNIPIGVLSDGFGGTYVADGGDFRIRHIDPAGIITTVAGTGEQAHTGDGGPASEARLGDMLGMALEPDGSLLFVDGSRVRRIRTDGLIERVAGVDADQPGGDGGPALEASFAHPTGVEFDAATGRIYVSDPGDARIRVIDPDGTIHTAAGTGESGFAGDGGLATDADLSFPVGMAMDRDGALLFADADNHRIRRIDPDGIITTLAGTGEPGREGDGGPALEARLYYPLTISADADGDRYLVDGYGVIVRRIDRDGIITRIAGTWTPGDAGLGGPALEAQLSAAGGIESDSAGNLIIADAGSGRVLRVDPAGILSLLAGAPRPASYPDDAPAIRLALGAVGRPAIDPEGRLLLPHPFGASVRRLEPDGTLRTIAGNGYWSAAGDGELATEAPLEDAISIAYDGQGRLYVAQRSHEVVRRIDASGIVSTVAGHYPRLEVDGGDGGPATEALIPDITDIAVAPDGTLYIAQGEACRVRRVDPDGRISTVAGGDECGFNGDLGPATLIRLRAPQGIALDAVGTLYIADTDNDRIRRLEADGVLFTVADSREMEAIGVDAVAAGLLRPSDIVLDAAGALYVADTARSRVVRIDPDRTVTLLAGTGVRGFSGEGPALETMLAAPTGLALGLSGELFITDASNFRAYRLDAGMLTVVAGNGDDESIGDGGPVLEAAVNNVTGLAAGADGTTYFADFWNSRLRSISPDGMVHRVAGTGDELYSGDGGAAIDAHLNRPEDIVLDDAGVLWFSDTDNGRVRRIADGIITTAAGGGAIDAGLSGAGTDVSLGAPTGLALGPDGALYVADAGSSRVLRLSADGVVTPVAGTGASGYSGDGGLALAAMLDGPNSLAVDDAGKLYIADSGNGRVRHVNTSGVITTVAGAGDEGSDEEGIPALEARIAGPAAIVLRPGGGLFLAEQGAGRVRYIDPEGLIWTIAGNGDSYSYGDGGPARDAAVRSPAVLELDASGDLLIGAGDGIRRVYWPAP